MGPPGGAKTSPGLAAAAAARRSGSGSAGRGPRKASNGSVIASPPPPRYTSGDAARVAPAALAACTVRSRCRRNLLGVVAPQEAQRERGPVVRAEPVEHLAGPASTAASHDGRRRAPTRVEQAQTASRPARREWSASLCRATRSATGSTNRACRSAESRARWPGTSAARPRPGGVAAVVSRSRRRASASSYSFSSPSAGSGRTAVSTPSTRPVGRGSPTGPGPNFGIDGCGSACGHAPGRRRIAGSGHGRRSGCRRWARAVRRWPGAAVRTAAARRGGSPPHDQLGGSPRCRQVAPSIIDEPVVSG